MGLFRDTQISDLESEVRDARTTQRSYEADQRLLGQDQSNGIQTQQARIDRALGELHTLQEIEKYRAKD